MAKLCNWPCMHPLDGWKLRFWKHLTRWWSIGRTTDWRSGLAVVPMACQSDLPHRVARLSLTSCLKLISYINVCFFVSRCQDAYVAYVYVSKNWKTTSTIQEVWWPGEWTIEKILQLSSWYHFELTDHGFNVNTICHTRFIRREMKSHGWHAMKLASSSGNDWENAYIQWLRNSWPGGYWR